MIKTLALMLALILLTSCIIIEEIPSEKTIKKPAEEKTKEETKPAQEPAQKKETKEEIQSIRIEKNPQLKNPIPEFLEKTPEAYWYYNVNKNIEAKVHGEWRSSAWESATRNWDLAKWNPSTGELYILFGEISDYGLSKIRGDGKGDIKKMHKAYMKIPMESYPYSPIDWMMQFKDAVPAKKNTAEQVLHVEDRYYSSNLSLVFENEGGEGTILRFDKKNNVPVIVERTKDGFTFEKIQLKYDTAVYDFLNKRTKKITKEMTEMPEEYIVFSEAEARAYIKGGYYRDPLEVNPFIMMEKIKKAFEKKEEKNPAAH